MGRASVASIIVFPSLALLGACMEVVPRSSVPFQASVEREIRYAAEVTLAIKENRRDAFSEAAANGRAMLPQMPEIWASTPAYDVRERAAAEDQLTLLDAGGPVAAAGPAVSPGRAGCAEVQRDRHHPDGCPSPSPSTRLGLPPLFPAAIAPAAAPEGTADTTAAPPIPRASSLP